MAPNLVNYAIKIAQQKQVEAEAMLIETTSSSVTFRKQELETFTEASESNLTLRIITQSKRASVSTNLLQESTIEELLTRAINIAEASPSDLNISLPKTFSCPSFTSEDIAPNKNWLIETAKAIENESLNCQGITNSNGATAAFSNHKITLANTDGFYSSYSRNLYALSAEVIAGEDQGMQAGDDYCVGVRPETLLKPSDIGKKAAQRAIEALFPRKISTAKVPVIFDARVAANSLLKSFSNAINGSNLVSKSTFLLNKLNCQIFSKEINIIDDPLMQEGVLSRPFDDEGTISNKLILVENGVLKSWLLDTYHAKKLNLKSTGHAKQSKGLIKPEHSNLYMTPGNATLEKLIADIPAGLYITDVFGFGGNLMTGDYSQGVRGFWIEEGKIQYPVAEVTIAGNLLEMFSTMKAANDLQFKYSVNSPAIFIPEMIVAGT